MTSSSATNLCLALIMTVTFCGHAVNASHNDTNTTTTTTTTLPPIPDPRDCQLDYYDHYQDLREGFDEIMDDPVNLQNGGGSDDELLFLWRFKGLYPTTLECPDGGTYYVKNLAREYLYHTIAQLIDVSGSKSKRGRVEYYLQSRSDIEGSEKKKDKITKCLRSMMENIWEDVFDNCPYDIDRNRNY